MLRPVLLSVLLIVGVCGSLFFGFLTLLSAWFASAFPVHVMRDGNDDDWLTFWARFDGWRYAFLHLLATAAFLATTAASLMLWLKIRRAPPKAGTPQ